MIEAKKRLRELRSIEIKIAQDNDEIECLPCCNSSCIAR